jgi:hypothetical protein
MQISTTLEFKNALRAGPYAWPGGYPTFFVCDDGEALCCKCAWIEAYEVMRAINARNYAISRAQSWKSDWPVVGADINYEDTSLYCANCNEQIESAYGE